MSVIPVEPLTAEGIASLKDCLDVDDDLERDDTPEEIARFSQTLRQVHGDDFDGARAEAERFIKRGLELQEIADAQAAYWDRHIADAQAELATLKGARASELASLDARIDARARQVSALKDDYPKHDPTPASQTVKLATGKMARRARQDKSEWLDDKYLNEVIDRLPQSLRSKIRTMVPKIDRKALREALDLDGKTLTVDDDMTKQSVQVSAVVSVPGDRADGEPDKKVILAMIAPETKHTYSFKPNK